MHIIRVQFIITIVTMIIFNISCVESKPTRANVIGTWEHLIEDNNDNYSKIIYLVSHKEDGTFKSIVHGLLKSNTTTDKFAIFLATEEGDWEYNDGVFKDEILEVKLLSVFGDQDLCNVIEDSYQAMEEKRLNNEFEADCKLKFTDKNTFTSTCKDNNGNIKKYKWRKISDL